MQDLSRRTFFQFTGVAAAAAPAAAAATMRSGPASSPIGTAPAMNPIVAAAAAGQDVFATIVGATASSAAAGSPASKVIDGDSSTNASRWVSDKADPAPTLTLELATATTIRRMCVISGYLSGGYQAKSAVRAFRVEAEVDGAWVAVAEVADNDQLVVQLTFDPVLATRVRMVITEASSQDTIARVFEVYLYTAEMPIPLRHQPKPQLTFETIDRIENENHRVTFYRASWDGGAAIVHDLAVRSGKRWAPVNSAAERFDDQWVLLRGDRGSAADYYDTMAVSWIDFDTLTKVDERTVELGSSTDAAGEFRLTWNLQGDRPRLTYRLTAAIDADHVVGYQAFSGRTLDGVGEVLCGPLQHAKVVRGLDVTANWLLPAPFCLSQITAGGQELTTGIYLPAEEIPFENEHQDGAGNQRYGMSLVDQDGLIRPLVFAPQVGERSALTAGQTATFTIGLIAEPATLTATYERLLRHEYGYRDYRENIYGQSMTDTMYHLIDLMKTDSGQDDSVDFQPSPSGWWNRAKGFIDIENDQSVRTTSAGVLLESYLLTGDDQLYDERALPTMEFHLSRNGYGWTPKKGFAVYGDKTLYKLGSIPFDASTLAPLYKMTGGWNKAIAALALARSDTPDDYWLKRTPWSTSLSLYRMTGDKTHLREAESAAKQYLADELDGAYTANLEPKDFQYFYAKAWTELLELYEATGTRTYLDAAHTEARRYVTQVYVRPVPGGTVSAPIPPVVYRSADDWKSGGIFDYPRKTVDPEDVPAWVVSTNGGTFETMGTYANLGGGFTLNPAWAPFLLRLATYCHDDLLADVAANSIVGRYTNYPGYYNRQFMPQQLQPDYPLVGPNGISAIYYTHEPVQLGMTIDWLINEQQIRSRGAIEFPSEFEADYVWFKYHTYGHLPGTFYGDRNVWLWMPKGIVSLDNPQLNWVSAEGNGKLYLSLTNASARPQSVTVTFGPELSGIAPGAHHQAWVIQDNGRRRRADVRGGTLTTTVSPKGITAVIVAGVDLEVPMHRPVPPTSGDGSFHLDDESPIGIVRGMLLVKPDLSRYDAYLQAATESPATLHYSTDGGATYTAVADKVYPNEWTIPVTDLDAPFSYYVEADGTSTAPATLSLTEAR